MKIIVTDRKAEQFHFRPDSTLVKNSTHFYIPPFLSGLAVSLGFAFKVDKPAKSIKSKYSSRYISKYAEGLLLYGIATNNNHINSYKTATTCFDNSVYIVNQMKNMSDCSLSLSCNEKECFSKKEFLNLEALVGAVLEKLSAQFSFKTGDIIFVECSPIEPITIPCDIKLYSNQTPVLEFKIK
ncbi:MAG: hypothetical protein WCR71_01565 [Bacteroidales bacterium]